MEWLVNPAYRSSSDCNPFWKDDLDAPEALHSLEARKTSIEMETSKSVDIFIDSF